MMTSLLCALLLALTATASGQVPAPAPASPAPGTALDRYVAAPDPSFEWNVTATLPAEGVTVTLLRMTSQRWLTEREVDQPLWKHWLTVIRPPRVKSDIALLYIGGGEKGDPQPTKAPEWLVRIARDTGTVVAELRSVPDQPIVFTDDPDRKPRFEDDLIAYAWDKFLRTGDERWPARLPMTKSAVRAMDAVQAFAASKAGGGARVTRFVITGASKRGWTTWTTAAVDRRVTAIAPAVIDLLNLEPSFTHHFQAYGAWSDAVQDYVDHGIMDWRGSPEFRALLRIEEPYEYRDRLTMPKYLVNASGDEFFLPDSSRFYFDDLRGEKHLRYVPNTGHSLAKTDAAESLEAFYTMVVQGRTRPEVRWSFQDDGTIRATTTARPEAVRLWQATNPEARNFRIDVVGPAYAATPVQPSGPNTWVARVPAPPAGWTAFFLEFTFRSGGAFPLKVTTGVRVVPDTLPYAAPEPKRAPPRSNP